jgi:molybdopterin biosynthesis enzyme
VGEGADIVVCTGGMSVDADDRTPGGIALVADKIAFHGVPVLPGGMLMMGFIHARGRDIAVIGAPACVVHDERTALDRILPFLFAGLDPTPHVRSWGVGGLCEGCSPCHWPECRFSSGA